MSECNLHCLKLTDFHVGLERKNSSKNEASGVGNERSPDIPQEMERILTAVQQVETTDDVILLPASLPLVDAHQSVDGAHRVIFFNEQHWLTFTQQQH